MEIPTPLIIICFLSIFALIICPLIISFKAEKKDRLSEWKKIKEYGNKINAKTRKNNL